MSTKSKTRHRGKEKEKEKKKKKTVRSDWVREIKLKFDIQVKLFTSCHEVRYTKQKNVQLRDVSFTVDIDGACSNSVILV